MEELGCSIAGVTLSSLLFQVASSSSDVEGFLYGTTLKTKKLGLSDEDSNDISGSDASNMTNNVVAIQSYEVKGSNISFYDSNAKIDSRKFVFSSKLPLIGWFKFRRNTTPRPSLREHAVHTNLEDFWKESVSTKSAPKISSSKSQPNSAQTTPTQFPLIFALITHYSTSDLSVHSFDYCIYHMHPRKNTFQRTKLKITNLVNSSDVEYNDFVSLSPFPTSLDGPISSSLSSSSSRTTASATNPFRSLLSTFPEEKLMALYGNQANLLVEQLQNFTEHTLQHLQTVADEVSNSTLKIRQLEEEISQLKLQRKKQSKEARDKDFGTSRKLEPPSVSSSKDDAKEVSLAPPSLAPSPKESPAAQLQQQPLSSSAAMNYYMAQ